MGLAPGTRLGPYEIGAPLGTGGMGEVYRARDTRLERTVAIKILPAQFSTDPLRKQRFEREAKAISGLNHPHICILYDVGQQDGIDYLVMECVEGETLAKRLDRGPLAVEQVVRYGAQIASALDKAHSSGVVHRDLKPGNIVLTSAGAKLLDFGLAKSASPLISDATRSLTSSPTLVTEEGTIVGTFQYMSPEQVEGKEVDARSDIFSLGAVLYEMVTGQRAFTGKSQLSVASAILEKDPEAIGALKPLAPPALDHAIRRCLAKDPEERWQSARDLASELKWIEGSPTQVQATGANSAKNRERALWSALAIMSAITIAAIAIGLLNTRHAPVRAPVVRAHIKPMPNSSFISSRPAGFALSPDGTQLAYVASTPEGQTLWVRPIDSLKARQLGGTDGAAYPFWSPDSRFIGFFAGGKLKKIDVAGGPPLTLSSASDGRGGTWNRQGDILFAPTVNTAIHRVSASGGPVTTVTTRDESKNETSHRWPYFLPDGRHFLYLAGSAFTPRENATNSIILASLDAPGSKLLIHTHAGAIYASGHILFLRQFTLMAQPFDEKRLELASEAMPVADPVQEDLSVIRGAFAASETGLLAYVEGMTGSQRELLWFDRQGKKVGAVPGRDAYSSPRISRDGKRLAFYLDALGFDIWSYDEARGVKTPLTFGSISDQSNYNPVWSADGRWIAYTSHRNDGYSLYRKSSDGSGSEELLLEGVNRTRFVSDWSPDGKVLTYHEAAPEGWAIWMLPLDGRKKPYTFLKSEFSEREASFSPDGKWVAYCSNESGEYKVYVVPFPGPGGKWQVSSISGCSPHWRRDAKEIFYLSAGNKMMAVEVATTASSLRVGAERSLFQAQLYGIFGRYDVTADGQRFVMPSEPEEPTAAIALAVNWDKDLTKKP
jgi:serine/threonine protein kinase